MVNDKMVSFRVEPYLQEAMVQVLIDILVVIISLVLVGILKNYEIMLLVIIIYAIYITTASVFYYRRVFMAIIDRQKKDYKTEIVNVNFTIKEEYAFFAADALGHSNVRLFYPKKDRVSRYKITAINDNGEKIKLRSVISFSRLLKFAFLEKDIRNKQVKVTYLKRSKILLNLELLEDINKIKGKKNRNVLEKSLYVINNLI